jgi:hypothetical protein
MLMASRFWRFLKRHEQAWAVQSEKTIQALLEVFGHHVFVSFLSYAPSPVAFLASRDS